MVGDVVRCDNTAGRQQGLHGEVSRVPGQQQSRQAERRFALPRLLHITRPPSPPGHTTPCHTTPHNNMRHTSGTLVAHRRYSSAP